MTLIHWRYPAGVVRPLLPKGSGLDTFAATGRLAARERAGSNIVGRSSAGTRPAADGSSDCGGCCSAGDAAGEQASAEEGAFQGVVAVHAAAAEAGDLTSGVDTG
jgi:hypothetical protein